MPWGSATPQDRWERSEMFQFLREIYVRFRCFGNFTWNPPNVPANSTVDTTLTTTDAAVLKGLRSGMPVTVSPPSAIDAGIIVAAVWVPADDQLTIRLGNLTGAGINPASGTWAFKGGLL